MPQVNEVSWFISSIKYLFIMIFILCLFNTFSKFKILKNVVLINFFQEIF